MKNLLLLTILLSTIACNGSGGGPLKVDPETNKLVQTIDHYSNEECIASETATLIIECNDIGLKPLTSDWRVTPSLSNVPRFKLENGITSFQRSTETNYNSSWAKGKSTIDLANGTFNFVRIPLNEYTEIDWVEAGFIYHNAPSFSASGIIETDDETGETTLIPTTFTIFTNVWASDWQSSSDEEYKTINDLVEVPTWELK